jgi:TP901 family phage tail tape measure protein
MADDIKIGLDGRPLVDAAAPAINYLKQFSALIDELDKRTLKGLARESRNLVTQLKEMGREVASSSEKLVNSLSDAVGKAGKDAKTKGKATFREAGKASGVDFVEALEQEVAKAKVKISAPRMILPSGLTASVGGNGLGSADAVMSQARKLMAESGARTSQDLAAEARARAELLKMEADSSRLTYTFRSNYLKNEQLQARKTAAQEQADSNRTFQMRERYLKAEESATRRAAALRTAGIDRDAGFLAATPAAQLSRASRVASARSMGLSEADAVAKYGAAAVAASRDLDRLKGAQDGLSASFTSGLSGSREMHSAVRGLAGAANGLFLTYGSLIPLTATFFTATAVKEAIKSYKDLEYQIKFVRALEEDGGKGVSERSMRQQVGDIAVQAGYDPLESSKGLRLLAQSGLTAQEALAGLPAVLNTARVGELGVAEATETLTGQVHAFGLQMSDMEHVGDVLAKAGAISNTSVGKMSESMKQASTIAQQYGLKIEEVSTILVAMAKRNITGSAAGTATANLFRELGSPHGKEAKQIAKDLGISLWDPLDKSRKDFFERFVPELRKSLEVLNPESQAYVLNRLTNNRGEKALGALLGLTDEALADIKSKLEQASGFTAKANEQLMDSVQGDLDRLKAAFTNALAEAGSNGSADFRSALQGIHEILASEGFQEGLNGLLKGFGALAKLGVGAAEALGMVYGWVSKLLFLPELIGTIGQLYDKLKDPSGTNAAIAQGNAYITNLDTQIRKVRELIAEKARADGTVASPGMASLRATRDDAEAKFKAAAAARDKILADQAAGRPAIMGFEGQDYARAKRAYDDAQTKLLAAHDKNIQLIALERQYKSSFEPTVQPGNALSTGARDYKLPEKPDRAAAASARRAADEDFKNEKRQLDLIASGNKLLVEQVDTEAKARENALQQSYARGLLDYESYQQKLTQAQQGHALVRINLAEAEQRAINAGLAELKQKAAAQKAAGKADTDDALANEIQSQTQRYLAAEQKVTNLLAEQKAAAEKVLTDRLKPAADLIRNAEKESVLEDERMRQELAKLQVKGSGLALSEREQFVQSEILRVMGEQEKKLAGAQAIMRDLEKAGVFAQVDSIPELAEARSRLQALIDSRRVTVDSARPVIAAAAGRTFDEKQWASTAQRLSNSVEGSVKDGLVAGLMGDPTAFQNLGQTLQKTVVTALVDAFYDAFVKDAVNGLAQSLVSSLRDALSGAAGGGKSGSGLLGSVLSIGGALAGVPSLGTSLNVANSVGMAGGDSLGSLIGLMGWSGGGFTGQGGKYEPAGVVHRGEFVVNAENTRRLGLGFLNSLNEPGYADGGYVGMDYGPSLRSNPAARVQSSANAPVTFAPETHINVDSRSDRAAVIADVQRVVAENQKAQTEQLKRLGVIPQ